MSNISSCIHQLIRICFLLCLAISMPSYAMKNVLTLTAGSSAASTQKSQTVIEGDTLFIYQPKSSSELHRILGVFVGEEYSFNRVFAWQFGLALYHSANASIHGLEFQASTDNPQAINYWKYQYKISNKRMMFENKFIFALPKGIQPYLLAGFGESSNTCFGFQVTQQNSGEVATAIYNNHQNKSFAYELGLGLDIDIFSEMRVGVGYHYSYLGKANLGTGTLDTHQGGEVFLIPALYPKKVFNHEVVIQVSYLF